MPVTDRAVYPTQPQSLQQSIRRFLDEEEPAAVEGELLALIVPDTNLLRSGTIAARLYRLLENRSYETVVLISPSHTGGFRRMNICGVDHYRTPLGSVPVNDRMRDELCDEDDDIYVGDEGHYHTDGVDVQLPYLQEVLGEFDIVPIVMGDESPEFCRELGLAVGEVMFNRRTLVVASADVLAADGEGMDRLIELIEKRDVNALMAYLNADRVQMEGRGPLLVAMIAAMHRRATHAHVLGNLLPEDDEPGAVGVAILRAS